jgi:hypothetical protein
VGVVDHSIEAFRAALGCVSLAGDGIDFRDRLVMLSVAEDAGHRIGVSFVSELSLVRHLMSRDGKANADAYLARSNRSAGPIGMRGVELPEGFRYRPWP